MKRILIIQTAFIGDVVLATSLIESIYEHFDGNVEIDFLLRKGNESLLENNPKVKQVHIWDKKKGKYREMFRLISQLRKYKFSHIFTLQRFLSGGLFTLFITANQKVIFKNNPLSFLFRNKVIHQVNNGLHEIERNFNLFRKIYPDAQLCGPKLYPSKTDFAKVSKFQDAPYICIAPNSVWYTKALPMEQWEKLIQLKHAQYKIYILGGPGDFDSNQHLSQLPNVENLCGQLSFLESAALMNQAVMNYVNDSGPLHFASAMNAPVTAFFCSTTPDFGFGPTNENGVVIESPIHLECKPCGLHGKKSCPLNHFNCAKNIIISDKC